MQACGMGQVDDASLGMGQATDANLGNGQVVDVRLRNGCKHRKVSAAIQKRVQITTLGEFLSVTMSTSELRVLSNNGE